MSAVLPQIITEIEPEPEIKTEQSVLIKTVFIKLSSLGYGWSVKNKVNAHCIGPSNACYFAVMYGKEIDDITLKFITEVWNRDDMYSSILNIDRGVGTQQDIEIIKAYTKIDGMRIVVEE
jgi:hypothetical protein